MEPELRDRIIYACVVGSRAFGLDTDTSDTDRRGCFLPSANRHWSMRAMPEQLVDDQEQECYWELEKFLRLALRANPNVLECLNSPIIEKTTPLAEEMLSMRQAFVSRRAYETYLGYADGQFRKLENAMRSTGEMTWPHAMHLLRLLYSGTRLMKEGQVFVDVSEKREFFLGVKRGEMSWEDLQRHRQQMTQDFEAALDSTSLPNEPDFDQVDEFLIRARRSVIDD